MQTETILYIILAGIVALLLALFQYLYKSKQRSKIYILLTFLRFVTIFSVLLLLINPKFDKTTYFKEKPNLVIAVDNSESITYLKQGANVKRLVSDLVANEALNERFDLELYQFGGKVATLDSLTFDEKQTNPSLVFDRLQQVQGATTSPTLLITDGNQTYGNDYEFSTLRYKQPIFPVIVGDTTTYTDVKIKQLNVNRYSYLKNQFPVEIIVVYSGNSAVDTQVKIISGNTSLFSQNVSFNKENTSQIIQLTLPANSVGIHTYKAQIVPVENERNIVNNVKNFAVEVISQKTHVAIVSDIIHPDLGALKKSIEVNEQRQATILKPNEYLKQSNEFQLVILYQPNHSFKSVFEEVQRQNLNTFVITGAHTIWPALNSFQSFYTQTITNQTENFQPVLNPNYSNFIIDDLAFSDYPPLTSEFGSLDFYLPVQTILYKSTHGIQLGEPLLATFEANERRVAILLGDGIWRWRSQTYLEDQSFLRFDNLISKLVQYLSTNQKKTRLNVTYNSFYNGTDEVKVNAQYFNKNYEFDSNANINISVKNKTTNALQTFPFILKNSDYEVDLSSLQAGDYAFTVTVANENLSNSGDFKILDYNVEQQFLNANVDKLQKLATKSQGKAYFIGQTTALLNQLMADERFAIIQKSTKKVMPLIDWKWLLVLIAIGLSGEWFIRKYHGLI